MMKSILEEYCFTQDSVVFSGLCRFDSPTLFYMLYVNICELSKRKDTVFDNLYKCIC